MKKGTFIAFEGLDASGKTTQFNAIYKKFAQHNIKVKKEKEPSDRNPVGLMIRDIVKGTGGLTMSPVSLAKLFSVDRYEHVVNEIKPHIDGGGHVLIDRFIFSSFAYQGLTCSYDEIHFYNRDAIKLLMPDLTVFIDTPPEICLERINNTRHGKELFDENGVAVRRNYFDAFERLKDIAYVLVVDGNQPKEVITDVIWKAVEPLVVKI